MRDFIETKMNEIFIDFKDELTALTTCCSLKDVRFNQGNIPDYSIPIIQQLYLLRYFPAYFIEYYNIYKEIIDEDFVDKPYRVLSIGMGCGVDYFGLEFALRDYGKSAEECVYYTGLDRIEWNYQEDFGNRDCNFLITDISELDVFEDNPNIIIFPKSIGEFDEQTFSELIEIFKNTDFKQKKICIVSSLRELNDATDVYRMDRIIDTLTSEHDYTCENPELNYTHFTKNVGLRKIFPDFIYPNDIKDFISELIEQCNTYLANGEPCEDDCFICLNKNPILTTAHIKYQIKKLYKD